MDLYPLGEKHANIIKSKSGKSLNDIHLQNVLNGSINAEDIKVSREVLLLQAEVARNEGNMQMAKALVRASELVDVDDDEILEVYNQLRPFRSTKNELLEIAKKFEKVYSATLTASLIRETADVYEERDLFRK